VEAITGGVLVRLLSAGEAGALKASTSSASPSGLLIIIAALFRAGLEKELDCEALALGGGCGV
jgi:hypothetical protein